LLPGTYLAHYEYTDFLGALHVCEFELIVMEQDTLIEEVTICEGNVVVIPWDGSTVTQQGLYCITDSICEYTQCLRITVLPTVITEMDTMVCPNGIIAPGDYIVILTSVSGCDSILILHVFSCTALENQVSYPTFLVYPNPARHSIFVNCYRCDNIDTQYELWNADGKLIEGGVISEEKISISIPEYSSGVALLKFINDHQTIMQKIVLLPD